ncbi:hypothetical protein SDC9_156082 [bioreactor metagenome]|uniref:Uncharacterized protein n=1 Tax=bioreactor metagenome TaxID=1076179 RepID=A0A645F3R3_9ZZZZ
MRKIGQRLAEAVASLIVWHEQEIRIASANGGIFLMHAGFAADGEVQRGRAEYVHVVAAPVKFAQRFGVQRG